MTLNISIGKWGGIYISLSRESWRLCLGFIAFTIFWFDLDFMLEGMADALGKCNNENQALHNWIRDYRNQIEVLTGNDNASP